MMEYTAINQPIWAGVAAKRGSEAYRGMSGKTMPKPRRSRNTVTKIIPVDTLRLIKPSR